MRHNVTGFFLTLLFFLLNGTDAHCRYSVTFIVPSAGSADTKAFFNPRIGVCSSECGFSGCVDSCTEIAPGQNSILKGDRYSANAQSVLSGDCMSAFLDSSDNGIPSLCYCISSKCYADRYAASTLRRRECKRLVCTTMTPPGLPRFCNFISTSQSEEAGRIIRLVPVAFKDQSYFNPAIRVIIEDRSSGSITAKTISMNAEHGQKRERFSYIFEWGTCSIKLERSDTEENMLCGTLVSSSGHNITRCLPTPLLSMPTISLQGKEPYYIKAEFPGCTIKENCIKTLRVNKIGTLRPVEMEAVRPLILPHDGLAVQRVPCAINGKGTKSIAGARRGELLCANGTKAQLRYLRGRGYGNLACLGIYHNFEGRSIIKRDLMLTMRLKNARKVRQFLSRIDWAGGVETYLCEGCGDHLSYENSLIRDTTTHERKIDIKAYELLTSGARKTQLSYPGMLRNFVQGYTHGTEGVVDFLQDVTEIHSIAYTQGNGGFVSDTCPRFPKMYLDNMTQEQLDALILTSDNFGYWLKKDIGRVFPDVNFPAIDASCPGDRIPVHYFSPPLGVPKDGNYDVMQMYEQGLCKVINPEKNFVSFSSTSHVFEGRHLRHTRRQLSPTEIKKEKFFIGCSVILAFIEGEAGSGSSVFVLRNRYPLIGVSAIFNIAKHDETRPIRIKPTMMTLCLGDKMNELLRGNSDCVQLSHNVFAGMVHPNPPSLEYVRSGERKFELLHGRNYPSKEYGDGKISLTCIS